MFKPIEIPGSPLQWPAGWPRTPASKRRSGRYQVSFGKARDHLVQQLKLLDALDVVISSDLQLRLDGLPLSKQREPADPGVAVYWCTRTERRVIACDAWATTRENLRAIGLTVDALRQIERAGATQVLDRAYQGLAALPPGPSTPDGWRSVFGFSPTEVVTPEQLRRRYRELVKTRHPDHGGTVQQFQELERAWQKASSEHFFTNFDPFKNC